MERSAHQQTGGRILQCPKCGSSDVRRTAREGFIAWVFRHFGRAPFLCRSCHIRFFRVQR
jgi:hypothetical protein